MRQDLDTSIIDAATELSVQLVANDGAQVIDKQLDRRDNNDDLSAAVLQITTSLTARVSPDVAAVVVGPSELPLPIPYYVLWFGRPYNGTEADGKQTHHNARHTVDLVHDKGHGES